MRRPFQGKADGNEDKKRHKRLNDGNLNPAFVEN